MSMRRFVFLTEEGFTQTPSGEDVENLQVLGIADGKDEKDALTNLLKDNKYLFDADYESVVAFELRDEKPYDLCISDYK